MKIERKVLKDGASSAAVVLPIDWRKATGIDAGDVVEIDMEPEQLDDPTKKVWKVSLNLMILSGVKH